MIDERAFVSAVEEISLDQLAILLARPTKEEERILRLYLGAGRYKRMRNYAVRRSLARGPSGSRGNVVLLPGVMGSELASIDHTGSEAPLWIMPLRIIDGHLERLKLSEDGRTDASEHYTIRATRVLQRYYGESLLALSAGNWNVKAFSYDWRKDLDLAADELNAQISLWFDDDAPVHLVAHSMGGLVARTFIKNHPRRWKSLWDEKGKGARGGRLIMLGTPNHGSFGTVRSVLGLEGIVRLLDHADLFHTKQQLLQILNGFPGLLQMLPSPFLPGNEHLEALYDPKTYPELNVANRHLKHASQHHQKLLDVVDSERMINIVGANQPTWTGIVSLPQLNDNNNYVLSNTGDGRIPHELSHLAKGGRTVPCYYVEEGHADLLANDRVLLTLSELLERGSTADLPTTPPADVWSKDECLRARVQLDDALAADEKHVEEVVNRLRARGGAARVAAANMMDGIPQWRSGSQQGSALSLSGPLPQLISNDEGELADLLTRDVLARSVRAPRTSVADEPEVRQTIEIALVVAGIENLPDDLEQSVDAISVGHYTGVLPQAAERAIDDAISSKQPPHEPGILTGFAQRGLIRGDLGQPFIMPDPRSSSGRVVILAGMGLPGRFGAPELMVLARELVWTMNQLGKCHLATVLIGAGMGNLDHDVAVAAWLRGISAALDTEDGQASGSDAELDARQPVRRTSLQRITFVQQKAQNARNMLSALKASIDLMEKHHGLSITYTGPDEDTLNAEVVVQREKELAKLLVQAREAVERAKRKDAGDDDVPEEHELDADRGSTRVTVGLAGNVYRFGAITSDAAIPEREISLDPLLVMSANDELAAESNPALQLERGIFLQGLLMPPEVRGHLQSTDPVVMMLDATTARIHWEMVAQPDPTLAIGGLRESLNAGDVKARRFEADRFLGTSRGFTRQLRTTFASLPEPPASPRKTLRVLVVADPSEDMPLPGAEAEGLEVADVFEAYNRVTQDQQGGNRVIVDRLLGPRDATRTTTLRYLMLRPYDVLHFAGHCFFNRDQPDMSGWIFSNGEYLTAHELNRIDRIPKFVFSNACESGITPDRSELRSDALAPSFAEAFFARGVANFVCTAWPVDDSAARRFARTLYLSLLGITEVDGHFRGEGRPLPMYLAMQRARIGLAERASGARTWGAYQHYGNPSYRFFAVREGDSGTRSNEQSDAISERQDQHAPAPIYQNGQSDKRTRAIRNGKASAQPSQRERSTEPKPAVSGKTRGGRASR